MIVSNVSNTKNKLSELLQRVQEGETVTILDRNRPVARLVPIPADDPEMRLLDLVERGKIIVPIELGTPWDLDPVRPITGEFVGALDVLLEERESER